MNNTVILVGRLTRKPEVRYTTESVGVATFTLAVQRDFKNTNGDYDCDFVNCVSYRNTAEFIGKYLQKGDLVMAHGRITTGSYETDKGEKRYTTTVTVEKIKILQLKTTTNETSIEETESKENINDVTLTDDDLPF